MDNGTWQSSGLTVANVAVGQHAISFKDVTGWGKPAGQSVTVQKAQTAQGSGVYGQDLGSVSVTITPAEAVTAGAQWNMDNGTWQSSGLTVPNVSVGQHAISFKDVTGWGKPAGQSVTVQKGQTAQGSGVYGQDLGSVSVTITPQGAITAGAQWNMDNGTWQNSGVTVPNVLVGQHAISFKDVVGWGKPAGQSVTVQKGQTAQGSGVYGQDLGSVSVTITPQGAITAGAQWNMDNGTWQNRKNN
jgi:hypothetical protein